MASDVRNGNTSAVHLRAEDRIATILDAACRVIAQRGASKLRVQDVAREAAVSKTLVHYYFDTRTDLLASALDYAERRARERASARIAQLPTASARLAHAVHLYLNDDPEFREDWILWSEITRRALFDPSLRPTIQKVYDDWRSLVENIIKDGVADGSIRAPVPSEAALKITVTVEGLNTLLLFGLVSRDEAQAHMRERLIELGLVPPPTRGKRNKSSDALSRQAYLEDLGRLAAQSIVAMGPLAASDNERASLQVAAGIARGVLGR